MLRLLLASLLGVLIGLVAAVVLLVHHIAGALEVSE